MNVKSLSLNYWPGLALIFSAMLLPPPLAASGGVIQFRGQIVENGCLMAQRQGNIAMTCPKDGKPFTKTVSLAKLHELTHRNDRALKTSIHYLDASRRLAILQLTYP